MCCSSISHSAVGLAVKLLPPLERAPAAGGQQASCQTAACTGQQPGPPHLQDAVQHVGQRGAAERQQLRGAVGTHEASLLQCLHPQGSFRACYLMASLHVRFADQCSCMLDMHQAAALTALTASNEKQWLLFAWLP